MSRFTTRAIAAPSRGSTRKAAQSCSASIARIGPVDEPRGQVALSMQAKELRSAVNSPEYEFRPYVTPDGGYLFFTSNRSERGNIWWVDARVIDDLKPAELQ